MRTADDSVIFAIERPSRKLMRYYTICCLLSGPLFPLLIIPYYFRYHTMRYRFGEEGISMRWGILFRREIILNYSRIQDIHLISNILERWLSLARLQIQTASGSAGAEMTIEGLEEFEAIRDFLYARMRGQKERRWGGAPGTPESAGSAAELPGAATGQLASVLREAASELRSIRRLLEEPERPSDPPGE